jgi:hypothetical protein
LRITEEETRLTLHEHDDDDDDDDRKYVEKNQFSLKSDKNNVDFT